VAFPVVFTLTEVAETLTAERARVVAFAGLR